MPQADKEKETVKYAKIYKKENEKEKEKRY